MATPLDPSWQRIFASKYPLHRLQSMQRLTGGASSITYRVTLENVKDNSISTRCLRCSGETGDVPTVLFVPMEVEAELMHLCASAKVPAPSIQHVLQRAEDGVEGIIMSWVDGETLGRKVIEMKYDPGVNLAFQCGQIAARIHGMKLDGTKAGKKLHRITPALHVENYRKSYAELRGNFGSIPALDYCFRWLEEHCPGPEQARTCLVHGDFRNGNLITTPQGVQAVIDWEISHIGDPMMDLGWMCVNSWRFGNTQKPVGGFGEYEDFYRGYESEGGQVDRKSVEFWIVWGQIAWSVMTLRFATKWLHGTKGKRNMEQAAIGRRVTEGILDSLAAILSPKVVHRSLRAPKTVGSSDVQPHQMLPPRFPSALHLVTAVNELVRGELMELVEHKRMRYLSRVAAGMLEMVQRELEVGDIFDKEEAERIKALLQVNCHVSLSAKRQALAAAINNKDIALDSIPLQEHLWQTILDRTYIDNPRYSGYTSAVAGINGSKL